MGASRHAVVRWADRDATPALTISIGVLVAIVWSALSPASYEQRVNAPWHNSALSSVGLRTWHDVVASVLLAIFFFAIGLELARERRRGALAHLRHAIAPVFAALGGMLMTALLAVVAGGATNTPALGRGWGIPMATDIAFTLGILALVGRRLPPTLRVFFLTLAIADDAFSVVVLATTGASSVHIVALCISVVLATGGWAVLRHRTSATGRWLYLISLWVALAFANVEPALAGVIAGALVPYDDKVAPTLERVSTRSSTVAVLPLFALVSCGVAWNQLRFHGQAERIIIAMVAIRIGGKVAGIAAGVWLARRVGLPPPPSITGAMLRAGSVLCAIGFTVPLLFAQALFPTTGSIYSAFALGLVVTSAVAAFVGGVLLRRAARSC